MHVLYVHTMDNSWLIFFLYSVGEKDEVSIRDVALMIAEAMDFKGDVIVSNPT